jgi:hypothetical protein
MTPPSIRIRTNNISTKIALTVDVEQQLRIVDDHATGNGEMHESCEAGNPPNAYHVVQTRDQIPTSSAFHHVEQGLHAGGSGSRGGNHCDVVGGGSQKKLRATTESRLANENGEGRRNGSGMTEDEKEEMGSLKAYWEK